MSTLLEQIEKVRNHALQLSQVSTERGRFNQLQTRSLQLQAGATHLGRLTTPLKVMKGAGIPLDISVPSKELRNKPAKVLEAFTNDETSLLNDDEQFAVTLRSPLESFTSRLRDQLTAAWRTHIESLLPAINETSLANLQNAGLKKPVAQMREIAQQLASLRSELPSSDSVLKQLKELSERATKAWSEIEKVPKPVLDFLRKASRGQAALSDLTDPVRKWLGEHDLLNLLRISISS